MERILYILLVILLFGVMIAVHEFGHFFTAKLLKVKVNEFAIGMGPVLWSRQKGETQYSLRAFPIGGYCAMEGEDEDTGDPRAFSRQRAWKKVVILCAGSFMNFLMGLVIVLLLYAGAVGIVNVVSEMGAQSATWVDGLINVFYLMALIAVNLAVMNLLPIPALDGGRIFFILLNAVVYLVARRRIPERYEGYVHGAAFVLLLGLMAVIAFKDVWQIFT